MYGVTGSQGIFFFSTVSTSTVNGSSFVFTCPPRTSLELQPEHISVPRDQIPVILSCVLALLALLAHLLLHPAPSLGLLGACLGVPLGSLGRQEFFTNKRSQRGHRRQRGQRMPPGPYSRQSR
ncbi:hypothetical protein F5Y13DRAFT_33816 [Hypoxylon sp. FL1857]|nr:hypothetical protein F5Y13DRAFT_33816 [Hypoxylon sp. FL1857]